MKQVNIQLSGVPEEGPHTKLTAEELGKWMNIANQNALERERFADLARNLSATLADANPLHHTHIIHTPRPITGQEVSDIVRSAPWKSATASGCPDLRDYTAIAETLNKRFGL